jgi:mannosidase alpha-like ER degradation enhancer 2
MKSRLRGAFFSLAREKVKEMFWWGYSAYMEHAFPKDELIPAASWNEVTCEGSDSFGGFASTLIDTLDTLAVVLTLTLDYGLPGRI